MCNIYEATQPVIKTSKLFEKNNHILPIPVSNAQYSARNECELVGLNKKKYGTQLPPPQILGQQVSPSVPMFFSNLNNNSNTISHFNPDSRNLFSINISQQQQPQYNQYQQHVPLQRLPTTPITPISQHQIQNSNSVNNSLYLPNTKQQQHQQAIPNYSINNSSNTITDNNMTYKNYMIYSTIQQQQQQQQRYISNSLTPDEQAHFSKLAYTKNPNLEQEANSSYRTNNKRLKFNNNKKNINNHHHNTLNSKKTHSLNQQNICKVCNKVCQSPSALKIHLAIHSDGKPFKCYFCDKFISKFASNRNRHMKQVHQWDNRKSNSNTSISSSTSRDEGI